MVAIRIVTTAYPSEVISEFNTRVLLNTSRHAFVLRREFEIRDFRKIAKIGTRVKVIDIRQIVEMASFSEVLLMSLWREIVVLIICSLLVRLVDEINKNAMLITQICSKLSTRAPETSPSCIARK